MAGYVPFRPRSVSPSVEKVVLMDPVAVALKAGQPTIQDVLNAIHDLSKKITQVSKNQQILETKLSHTEKYLMGVGTILIHAANWLYQSIYYYTIPPSADGNTYPQFAPHPPHWVDASPGEAAPRL